MDEAQALAWRDSTLVNIFLCVSFYFRSSCHTVTKYPVTKNVCLRQKHNVLNWVIKIACNIVEGQGAKDQQNGEGNVW